MMPSLRSAVGQSYNEPDIHKNSDFPLPGEQSCAFRVQSDAKSPPQALLKRGKLNLRFLL